MEKLSIKLSVIAAMSALLSACIGLFYTNDGSMRTVENIYSQQITLYGDGVYANNSLLKAAATKGTDVVMIITGLLLFAVLLICGSRKVRAILQSGLLLTILYATTCLIMGVSFNQLFLLYVLQFGSSLFAFVLSMQFVFNNEVFDSRIYEKNMSGTGIFMLIGGFSTLIWLTFIIPSIITGQPLENIEIYTTEPAFAIDLAIILPTFIFCGVSLLRKKGVGYKLAPILLLFLTGVGACVISQTVFQILFGVTLSVGTLFGMVGSFITLGIFAVVLNIRFFKFVQRV